MRNIVPLLPLLFFPPSGAPFQTNFPSLPPSIFHPSLWIYLFSLSPSSLPFLPLPHSQSNFYFLPSTLHPSLSIYLLSLFPPPSPSSPSLSHLEFGSSGWQNRRGYLLLCWLSQVYRRLRLPCYFRLQGGGDMIIGKEEGEIGKNEEREKRRLAERVWHNLHYFYIFPELNGKVSVLPTQFSLIYTKGNNNVPPCKFFNTIPSHSKR